VTRSLPERLRRSKSSPQARTAFARRKFETGRNTSRVCSRSASTPPKVRSLSCCRPLRPVGRASLRTTASPLDLRCHRRPPVALGPQPPQLHCQSRDQRRRRRDRRRVPTALPSCREQPVASHRCSTRRWTQGPRTRETDCPNGHPTFPWNQSLHQPGRFRLPQPDISRGQSCGGP